MTPAKIADEIVLGFPLCGWLPSSGVFPPKLRPPDIHVETLMKMSASFSARTVSATKPSGGGPGMSRFDMPIRLAAEAVPQGGAKWQ